LPVVENTLRMHTDVLRFTTMRKDAKMDQVNSLKKSNPWRDLDDVPDAR
jgi:ribosomal protein S6